MRHSWTALMLAASLLALGGCRFSKEAQLEKVAKDWSYTIRASQVIPVYPLTEDVQPGDVFLVQVPIDRQQEIYRSKGFLPLDNHLDRIQPGGYNDFYEKNFLDVQPDTDPNLPKAWIRPASGSSWEDAPGASFPSYSFSVRRGSGINAAIPVQGIPVGLSLMGSDAADGSVVIERARTIGVDTMSLYRELQDWAFDNSDFLAYFAGDEVSETAYLRVVTRVYATGKLNVVLNDASSAGATGDVGDPKPVELLNVTAPTDPDDTKTATLENYKSNLATLQQIIDTAAPGASIKVAAATSRSVTLSQEFDPPLVLGYLGFDVAIAPGGLLGPPIPTQAVLDRARYGSIRPNETPAELVARRSLWVSLYGVLEERVKAGDEHAIELKAEIDELGELIPDEPVTMFTWDRRNKAVRALAADETGIAPVGQRTYQDFLVYRGRVERSISLLTREGVEKEALAALEMEADRLTADEVVDAESDAAGAILLYALDQSRR